MKTSNCCCTLAPKVCKPSMSVSMRPSCAASGKRRMRVAPGFDERMVPSAPRTITPAVRLSRIVCRLARAAFTCCMLVCTAWRASESCCVMSANERVNPSSSSLPRSVALGVKSPAATSRTPSASNSKGRTIWLPSNTASKTPPNMAMNRLNVRVPMYMRRKPSRANARSWYSRLACVTANASRTSDTGNSFTASR